MINLLLGLLLLIIPVERRVYLIRSQMVEMGLTGIPNDLEVIVHPFQNKIAGQYNPYSHTLLLSDRFTRWLDQDNALILWIIVHELSHTNQEIKDGPWGNFEQIAGGMTNSNYRSFMEGQNDLMTAIVMSDLYDYPVDNSIALLLSDQQMMRDTGHSDGVAVVGYQAEAEIWAGIAVLGATKYEVTPFQYLLDHHNNGFDGSAQLHLIMDLFPEHFQNGHFPAMAEIEDWLKEGRIDSYQAYRTMLVEGVQDGR